MERHWDRKAQANDVADFAHLSVAVPYADIVVTEKFWTHLVRAERLDKKYNTRVTSDLLELLDLH
jgi:hypothetical protein